MARERYLLDESEDTIHANEIVPTTPKEKRQNWWFYNRVKLLVGAICVLLLGSIVYSIATKVSPDYTIALMTSYTMPDAAVTQLEEYLTQYAEDRNGDGKTVVTVVNYIFSESTAQTDPTQQQASVVKFTADASTGESILYIHNGPAFDSMKTNFGGYFLYNDGTPMPEDATDYENAMVNWNDVKALAEFKLNGVGTEMASDEDIRALFDDLRISLRTQRGTAFEKDEKAMAYYDDCMALYKRLQNDEKLTKTEG